MNIYFGSDIARNVFNAINISKVDVALYIANTVRGYNL